MQNMYCMVYMMYVWKKYLDWQHERKLKRPALSYLKIRFGGTFMFQVRLQERASDCRWTKQGTNRVWLITYFESWDGNDSLKLVPRAEG